jgi:hypothetical protein
MATIPKVAMLVAGAHFVLYAAPSAAFAQSREERREGPVAGEADPSVTVHLQGSETAELQQDTGDHKHWRTVCMAPCDAAVSRAFAYRVAGDGIRNSRVFSLHASGGDRETIDVEEGSKAGFVLGIVSVSVGGPVMFVGLMVVLASSFGGTLDGGSPDHGGQTLGLTLSGLGVAGVIGGAVAIATNVRTGVSQGPAGATGASVLPGGGAWTLAPAPAAGSFAPGSEGHAAGLERPLPPLVGVPLFGGRF